MDWDILDELIIDDYIKITYNTHTVSGLFRGFSKCVYEGNNDCVKCKGCVLLYIDIDIGIERKCIGLDGRCLITDHKKNEFFKEEEFMV